MVHNYISVALFLVIFQNVLCNHVIKSSQDNEEVTDLLYSDTSHADTNAPTDHNSNVLYINHGGGAKSSVRRTLLAQPQQHQPHLQAPFNPHVNYYPNSLFDGNVAGLPYFQDIPRILRRNDEPEIVEHNIPSTTSPPQPVLNSHIPSRNQYESPFFQNVPGSPQSELFPFFDTPFIPPPPTPNHVFQRRRLTLNNNLNEVNQNSIGLGYPSYTYYKGAEDDAGIKWPKIFKFTDGRVNLSDFEKDKKLGRIKFNKKDDYLDNIRRDSFLILHGGAYNF